MVEIFRKYISQYYNCWMKSLDNIVTNTCKYWKLFIHQGIGFKWSKNCWKLYLQAKNIKKIPKIIAIVNSNCGM